ncbi:unnamed protein product, partial [Medioppia subpectinata]
MIDQMIDREDYQDKLRDEISREIGDQVPVIQDKLILCYNMAFVMEMLRFRNPTPLSLFHKALVDCKLGPYNIPKSTQVVLHQAGSIFSNDKHRAVIFDDYGHSWESLRRISHTTIRFDIEQPELKKFKYVTTDFQTDLGNSLFLYEFIPVLRYFMANPLIKYKQYFDEVMNYSRYIYQKHDKTYDSKNLRDFCDILIAAKHEAIADDKQTAPYFTDDNLPAVLIELFMAGTETTHTTFQWLLLVMAYKPEYQDKLRAEISREIGDRVPVVEDKSRLNYTLAFVSEILRHKNPLPIGVFHKALVDSKIGEHPVAQNTQVVLHQGAIMTDSNHWNNPDKFEPERFLDEHGQFIQTKLAAYMPFSYGRRVCPGESLAINDLFLVLVRFIQLT